MDKNDPEREPITGNYKESCQTLGVGTRMLALVRRRSISRFKRPAATQATAIEVGVWLVLVLGLVLGVSVRIKVRLRNRI